MALTQDFAITRADVAEATSTPGGRGIAVNNLQSEWIQVTKDDSDNSGPVDLATIQRAVAVYVLPVLDDYGDPYSDSPGLLPVDFEHPDSDTLELRDLGDWTVGYIIVCGRTTDEI